MLQVVIRADSSFEIGTGHVMRCLTLAHKLSQQGVEVSFLCRNHPGNINHHINQSGFKVFELPVIQSTRPGHSQEPKLSHAHWLGAQQTEDAVQCIEYLKAIQVDWLVVDHYALDKSWEQLVTPHVGKVLVIDDLADREHSCDILLDQNLDRATTDYQGLVAANGKLLLGTNYSLLRDEFCDWRQPSLDKRKPKQVDSILLNMGGVDAPNFTEKVLQDLEKIAWQQTPRVHVVMGGASAHLAKVKAYLQTIQIPVELHVSINNMAELMAQSDLAIGAAGSTTWERCCLGLPSIMLVLAENQNVIADGLQNHQAAWVLREYDSAELQNIIQQITPDSLYQTALNASQLVDGLGCDRVVSEMGLNE